jgi:tight adherence protein B
MSVHAAAAGVVAAILAVLVGAAVVWGASHARRDPVLTRLHPARGRARGRVPISTSRLARPVVALVDRRRDGRVRRALPQTIDDLARSLRTGGSVRTALAEAAACAPPPLADELSDIVRAADHGIPLRHAIDRWAARRPTADVRLAVAALSLGLDAGTGLPRTLDGVATTMYERAAIEREARALSTQARYSAVVLGVAPLAFLAVVAALDPATTGFLLGTAPGVACLLGGVLLDIAGSLWMARITRLVSEPARGRPGERAIHGHGSRSRRPEPAPPMRSASTPIVSSRYESVVIP